MIRKLNYTFPTLVPFPSVGDLNYSEKVRNSCDSVEGMLMTLTQFQTGMNAVTDDIDAAVTWSNEKIELIHNDVFTVQNTKGEILALKQEIQAIRWQNLSQLPSGTINDGTIGTNITYSSFKIDQLIGNKQAEAPIVTGTITINEGETVQLTPSSGDPFVHFVASADIGTITVDKDNKVFYTAPSVETDTTATLTVYTAKLGYLKSEDVAQQVLIKQIIAVQIAPLVIDDLSGAEDLQNFLVVGSDLKSLVPGSTATTAITSYEGILKKAKLSYICQPPTINVGEGSTNTTLLTNSDIANGETIIVSDGISTDYATVAIQGGSTASILDNQNPFSDSSGIALFRLNGDTGGGTEVGSSNISFVAGRFDGTQALHMDASYGEGLSFGEIEDATHDRSFSIWFKDAEHGGLWISKNRKIYLWISDDRKLRVTARNGDGDFISKYTDIYVGDGNWHHVILFINGSNTRAEITVDNVSFGVLDIEGGASTDGMPFTGVGQNYKGTVAQIRYFNRALSADEKQIIFEEVGAGLEANISTANLASAVTKAFKLFPSASIVADGERTTTIESFSIMGDDLNITAEEQTISSPTIQYKFTATNAGDIIKSVSCELWEES